MGFSQLTSLYFTGNTTPVVNHWIALMNHHLNDTNIAVTKRRNIDQEDTPVVMKMTTVIDGTGTKGSISTRDTRAVVMNS